MATARKPVLEAALKERNRALRARNMLLRYAAKIEAQRSKRVERALQNMCANTVQVQAPTDAFAKLLPKPPLVERSADTSNEDIIFLSSDDEDDDKDVEEFLCRS
jgi:hypothetical protein